MSKFTVAIAICVVLAGCSSDRTLALHQNCENGDQAACTELAKIRQQDATRLKTLPPPSFTTIPSLP
ncbi:MAG TPA: hypothetical protein VMU16_02990 [Candidatus Binataceae bacterium]|nr:hypothetical protein [Candidatus Binataceae bacterium]